MALERPGGDVVQVSRVLAFDAVHARKKTHQGQGVRFAGENQVKGTGG